MDVTIDPFIDDNLHINIYPEIKAEGVLLEEKKDDIERLSQYILSKFIIYTIKFVTPKLNEFIYCFFKFLFFKPNTPFFSIYMNQNQ